LRRKMAEQVVLEMDEGLVKEEALLEGTRVVMMVNETREVRMGGVARWYNKARMQARDGVDIGRSHDGVLADDNQGTTDGEEAIDSRALGADKEPIGPSDTRCSRSEKCPRW